MPSMARCLREGRGNSLTVASEPRAWPMHAAGDPAHPTRPARMEGGYTELFELISPSCGDHPYLDYSEISPRLQWLRGPRALMAGLAVYEKHLGMVPRSG